MSEHDTQLLKSFTITSDDMEHALVEYPYASTVGILGPFAQSFGRSHIPELYEIMKSFEDEIPLERLATAKKLLNAFQRAYACSVSDQENEFLRLRQDFENNLNGPARRKLMSFLNLFAHHEEHRLNIASVLAKLLVLTLEDGQFQHKSFERTLKQYKHHLLKATAQEMASHPFPTYNETKKVGEWINSPNHDLHEEVITAFHHKLENMGLNEDQIYMIFYSWTRHSYHQLVKGFAQHISKKSYPVRIPSDEANWCRISSDKDLITLQAYIPFRQVTFFKSEQPIVGALRIEHLLTTDHGTIKPLLPGTLAPKTTMLMYEAYSPAGWLSLPTFLPLLEKKVVGKKEKLLAPFKELKIMLGMPHNETSTLKLPAMPPFSGNTEHLNHLDDEEEETTDNPNKDNDDTLDLNHEIKAS